MIAAPLAVLALIALADLVSGANAHLTRSVLDAGGLGDLADVAQRRLQLSAHSFARPIVLLFLPLVAALAVLAFLRRDRLDAWLRAVPALRAGLIGALAATVVGTLANDSGALLLEIGTAYILVFVSLRLERAIRADLRHESPLGNQLPFVIRADCSRLAIFLDLPGRREPARGGACRGVSRPWPPRSRARPLRPTRPPQPGAAPCRARSLARSPTT